jgi:hypothetical protein
LILNCILREVLRGFRLLTVMGLSTTSEYCVVFLRQLITSHCHAQIIYPRALHEESFHAHIILQTPASQILRKQRP